MGRLARRLRAAAPRIHLPVAGLRSAYHRVPGPRWARNAAALSAVAVVGLGGVGLTGLRPGQPHRTALGGARAGLRATQAAGASRMRIVPGGGNPAGGGTTPPASADWQPPGHGAAARYYRRIFLPDLLIVAPRGLTHRDTARLARIAGVRNTISFDGAQISAGGKSVSVIGVDPAAFRSWVPLRTASNQQFWNALSSGEFVAADGVARRLQLRPGSSYQLAGATQQVVTFGSAAWLRLSGIDLMVNQGLSRKLGLVHQVAALISAPGVSMTRLQRAVTRVLGASARMESLRGQQLPVSGTPSGGQVPTTYIQLFKESAARYCRGLSWTVLAAIGQIESNDGQNMGPSSAGALGPMQFLPSTWARWGIDGFGQTGPPDIMNPYDAVPSAARLLCAMGAAGGGHSLYSAIYGYNHADWYVREVLALAAGYAADYR